MSWDIIYSVNKRRWAVNSILKNRNTEKQAGTANLGKVKTLKHKFTERLKLIRRPGRSTELRGQVGEFLNLSHSTGSDRQTSIEHPSPFLNSWEQGSVWDILFLHTDVDEGAFVHLSLLLIR